MATVAQWEGYARSLEPLTRWNVPDTTEGRDLIERLRRKNDAGAALLQALAILKQGWGSFPAKMRDAAIQAVTDAVDQALSTIGQGVELANMAPVVGQIAAAFAQAILGFVETGQKVKKENQKISNFAHQRGHFVTVSSLRDPWQWVYSPAVAKMYAQFVKVRVGGDWDVVPCFTRAGLERDKPFLGVASPPDSGKCKKKIRIGLDYNWDPSSSCRRTLGLSALFYPWWSGAYASQPLPVWDPDTTTNANRLLVNRQTDLITDPGTNLRVPLKMVFEIRDRIIAYFQAENRAMYPIDGDGNVSGKAGPRVDARQDRKHVPSKDAKARWFLDDLDMIQPYPDQPGAELDRWGWPAPPGKPSNLGVTLAQRNTVVAMSAAFAARRASTIRNGLLSAALLQDWGPNAFDPDAVKAVEYAASQRRMLPVVGEGLKPKPAIARLPPPGTLKPKGGEDDGLAAAAALAALLFL